MTVVAPSVDMTLSYHASIQLLPPYAIVLDDWLIGYTESTASSETPVSWVKSNRGLLERLACAAEGKEALRIEVWEYKDKDVQWKICDGCGFVSHSEESVDSRYCQGVG